MDFLESEIAKGLAMIALGAALWFLAEPVYHLVWDALKLLAPILRMLMRGGGVVLALVGAWWLIDELVCVSRTK